VISTPLLIWLYTLAFAVVHSFLASQAVKRYAYRFGLQTHHYRLLYSLIGVLTTFVWLYWIGTLPDTVLYTVEGGLKYGLYALQVLGLCIVLAALQPIDGAVFLGLKQAGKQTDPFIVQGVFKYIRHPMYAGFMLFLLAKPEHSVVSLHFALAVSVYFIVGSKLEEKRMLAEHPNYADYQQKVGAFIPKLF
jgi:protein-S-isoprenylcysteine O-methyltransferase Ste14